MQKKCSSNWIISPIFGMKLKQKSILGNDRLAGPMAGQCVPWQPSHMALWPSAQSNSSKHGRSCNARLGLGSSSTITREDVKLRQSQWLSTHRQRHVAEEERNHTLIMDFGSQLQQAWTASGLDRIVILNRGPLQLQLNHDVAPPSRWQSRERLRNQDALRRWEAVLDPSPTPKAGAWGLEARKPSFRMYKLQRATLLGKSLFFWEKKTLRVFHLSNKALYFMPASDAFEKNVGFLSQTHNGTNCIFTYMEIIKIDHSRR